MTLTTDTQNLDCGILGSLLSDDAFWPAEPQSIAETGLTESFVEALLLKIALTAGTISGRGMSDKIGLSFSVVEPLLQTMRTRQLVVHVRPAAFNDYYYSLSESGQRRAQAAYDHCSYTGPAPVPLADYALSVEAQAGALDPVDHVQLETALEDISHDAELVENLGPAINSNAGLFLHGPPGNGKTTIASRLTRCLGQEVWIPHAIFEDGNLIKLQDDAYHRPAPVPEGAGGLLSQQQWDRRWMRIQRPTVVVGGELVMENLEVRHDARSNICEAPLQMKSNCGSLLIDDFGRQRVSPDELLNRWIIPLENQVDYLTLPTGKKIQIPFRQLIIFSTNLDPQQLVDEAFLRRVPYKIFVHDPSEAEFVKIFSTVAAQLGFPDEPKAARYLLQHYRQGERPLRRCHPRDLLTQVKNYCTFRRIPPTLRPDLLDRAFRSYFSTL